jgi:hypothetical protein
MFVATFAAGLICQALLFVPKQQLHPDEGEVLEFDYTNIDAGSMFMNDERRVYFPFTNRSGHDVTIEKVTYNNTDSVIPFWPLDHVSKTIPAGARDSIGFKRLTWGQYPEKLYDNGWTVHYKDLQTKQYLNIFCELKINQGQLYAATVKLDTVLRGEEVFFSVPVLNRGNDPVTLQTPGYWPANLSAHNSYPLTILPGETQDLGFQLSTGGLLNSYEGTVYFETNEEGRYPRFKIPYTGELISFNQPSVKFDSLELTLFLTQGGRAQFDFWFTSNGDLPLIFSTVKTSCGCLVAEWPHEPILPGERNLIKVKYDSNRVGPINKTITVSSNAAETSIALRVKGNVIAKPVAGN